MRADLHSHALPASGDSRAGVGELADAAAALGLEAVALTDHGSGDLESARRTFADRGVTLVPGREVSCDLGHVVVLSTDIEWLASLPPRCALPLPNSRRGPAALIWAHPAGWRHGGALIPPAPERGAAYLHAVEVLNGERLHQPDGVEKAHRLAGQLGLPGCGGSDAHDAPALGRCLTEVAGASDAESFIDGVVAGRSTPVLSERWARARGYDYERPDLVPYLR
jgi:predicted metal-dependent phosphoesterase TrpH